MSTLAHETRQAWRQARAWGWPFALGAAALAAAAAIALVAAPQARREAADARRAADRAERQVLRAADRAPDDRQAMPAPERFVAAFPGADARQARVAALLELAVRHSLDLRRGEFQLTRDKPLGLVRYSVTLPLGGSYAQLRAFIAEALAVDAALSLDRLRLRRPSATAPVVEADMTWSFYMQPASAAAPAASAPR